MRRLLIPIIILFSFVAGSYVGYSRVPEERKVTGLTGKENEITSQVNFAPFWKTWNTLNDKFVPADVSSSTPLNQSLINQKLVWGAIQGMVAAVGDPYTVFLPPSQSEIFKSDISGNFEGVGMEVALKDEVLTVVAPLKGSPSERAGVRAGDKIMEIDGESTQGLSIDEAVSKIRGEKGTRVILTMIRVGESEPLKIPVMRDVIDVPTIKTETRDTPTGKAFIISLYNFSANSPTLFRDALQEFVDLETDKLIIDLRGNPGGYL
ncbi:MAG: PDZ domain-containing protein, partial [Patescibacteria group bacterium]